MKKTLTYLAGAALVFAWFGVAVAQQQPGGGRNSAAVVQQAGGSLELPKLTSNSVRPRNIVFILTDDHRYDALGFLRSQSFIRTPNLDRLAAGGVHLPNAFVTTALCSPSRASILTGFYAHKHRVVDNNNPVSPDLVFFPQYLQKAGYRTAMIGKWHMGGESDAPQRGFDRWVSFRGQGTYLPSPNGLNVDGKKVPQKGYVTDELTDYAIEWLEERKGGARAQPFMLYLSHKGVHSEFIPPDRYRGSADADKFKEPTTLNPQNIDGAPTWVRNQRNSWHGVDFPYHSDLNIEEYYKRYAETLRGVDDSVGRVLDYLKENNLLESTLVVYMGDNGFAFGEHGLIDKRTAYEESMRVPMLAHCPELFKPGTKVNQVVANIDIAPTFLEVAGLQTPARMDGRSFLPLARGEQITWRDSLLYEYYWERNFPHTPTMHALRGDRYKYIHYQGIWDTDELYDLQADPLEAKNLIASEAHQTIVARMNKQLFDVLGETQGMYIPLYRDAGRQMNLRLKGRSEHAPFPREVMRDKALPPPGQRQQPPQSPAEKAPAGDPTKTGAPTEIKTNP